MPKPLSSLEERVNSLNSHAAPDMHPHSRVQPKIEIEALPDLQEVVTSSAVRLKLLRLVSQSIQYQKAEAEAKKSREPINREIKSIIAESCSSDKFTVDGNRVVMYETRRKSLSKEKLLDAGVSVQIINECTTESVSVGLKITSEGEDDRE